MAKVHSRQEHIERHKMLHRHLDELLADFISQNPEMVGFSNRPIMELVSWSHEQTTDPSDIHGSYE